MKIYQAEWAFRQILDENGGQRMMTESQIKRRILAICKRHGWNRRPQLKFKVHKSNQAAMAYGGRYGLITFGMPPIPEVVVLHEIAHILTPSGHGKVWRYKFLELMQNYMGKQARQQLSELIWKHGANRK